MSEDPIENIKEHLKLRDYYDAEAREAKPEGLFEQLFPGPHRKEPLDAAGLVWFNELYNESLVARPWPAAPPQKTPLAQNLPQPPPAELKPDADAEAKALADKDAYVKPALTRPIRVPQRPPPKDDAPGQGDQGVAGAS